MNFRFAAGESPARAIRRIAREQIDHAIEQLSPPYEDREAAIHGARRCMKKLRAVLRLVRDEIGDELYHAENRRFRDATRCLSDARDATVLTQTLGKLRDDAAAAVTDAAFRVARESLLAASRRDGKGGDEEMEKTMRKVADELRAALRSVDEWPIARDDFRALRRGLLKIYKRGRRAFAEVVDEPQVENLHEWRKQVKYFWYHIRILRPMWPELLGTMADELRDLSEALGDDHDFALLDEKLRGEMSGHPGEQAVIRSLIARRRSALQERALARGARIFAEKPKRFVGRLEDYWKVWRRERDGMGT